MTILFYFAHHLLLFVNTESVLVILTNDIFEFDKLIEWKTVCECLIFSIILKQYCYD